MKNLHVPCINGRLEELWLFVKGSPWFVDIFLLGVTNYIIAPDYNGGQPLTLTFEFTYAPNGETRTVLFAPKLTTLNLICQWNQRQQDISVMHLVCNPSPTKKLIVNGVFTQRFENANFSNCTSVSVTKAHLEKDTLLTVLNTLPAYDAATMSTVPTCSMYVNPELEGDADVVDAFLNLQTSVEEGGKGWTVAVTGISLTGAVSFGLRQLVYCKKLQDASGRYIDADNVRWDVSSGTTVLRHGVANEELGYEAFTSLEDALTEWGLTEYMEIPEEDLTEQTEQ
jgi:hypothetical protein